jgi:hypothetical protein
LAILAEQRILAVMNDEWSGDVYVIAATKGRKTVYWAAAVPQHRALDEVQRLLPDGWRATLSRRHLTAEEIAGLKMRDGRIRQLE